MAARLDLGPERRLLVALSGGADSVLLAHLVAAADPPVDVVCVHVDHDLRGDESRADAAFAARLCQSLGLPFVQRYAPIPKDSPDLEARARELRYTALLEEARSTETPRAILTGHHSDDALETLLMRWMRGGGLSNMSGLRERVTFRGLTAGDFTATTELAPIEVLRPLIAMRRSEVRSLLRDRGLAWRDDSSNDDRRFFRNRLRHGFLNEIESTAGPKGLANLESFSRAVETLEDQLARATAHITWHTPAFQTATGRPAYQGGEIERRTLMALNRPLMRRALWRLVTEGTGQAPSRSLLDILLDDLASGRSARHNLPGAWSLILRSDRLQLVAPARAPMGTPISAPDQILMPWGEAAQDRFTLNIPGIITLPDGRRISAEVAPAPTADQIPKGALEILVDFDTLLEPLAVRWPTTGDRFHPLGAPGTRPLRRFLSDAGVPREDRSHVPLVISAGRIIWVAGLRPAESVRVRSSTRRVLRLTLHAAAVSGRKSDAG